MNHLTKSKIAIYLTLIFAAGAVSGGLVTWSKAREKAERPQAYMDKVCHRMRERLQSKLELTPEQMARIEPILEDTARQMRGIHGRTMDQIDAVIRKSNEAIAQELTPDQKKKLDEMEAKRRDWIRKCSKGENSSTRM